MKQQDLLLISVSIFITIVAWIGFNIYHTTVSSTIPRSLQEKIEPIEGEFDTEIIESIKKRENVLPVSVITQNVATPSPQVTPLLSPRSLEATPAATEREGLAL